MYRLLTRPLLAGLVSLALAAPASAAMTVNFLETATGVTGSFAGSLSLAGFTAAGGNPISPSLLFDPGLPYFVFGANPVDAYNGTFAAVAFGINVVSGAPAAVGDPFGMANQQIFVPQGYTPGSNISGTFSFDPGSTFASLGITAGTYVNLLAQGDNITIIATPIPEASTYALMLAGLGVLGFAARRRRGTSGSGLN